MYKSKRPRALETHGKNNRKKIPMRGRRSKVNKGTGNFMRRFCRHISHFLEILCGISKHSAMISWQNTSTKWIKDTSSYQKCMQCPHCTVPAKKKFVVHISYLNHQWQKNGRSLTFFVNPHSAAPIQPTRTLKKLLS